MVPCCMCYSMRVLYVFCNMCADARVCVSEVVCVCDNKDHPESSCIMVSAGMRASANAK